MEELAFCTLNLAFMKPTLKTSLPFIYRRWKIRWINEIRCRLPRCGAWPRERGEKSSGQPSKRLVIRLTYGTNPLRPRLRQGTPLLLLLQLLERWEPDIDSRGWVGLQFGVEDLGNQSGKAEREFGYLNQRSARRGSGQSPKALLSF